MTILVPIDFSGMAAEAASYAAALARKLDAHVILLHAIPPYDVWWTGPDKDLIEEAQLRQETVKKSLVEQGVDEARVENHIVGCFPIGPYIRDLIVQRKVDYVVMGYKGSGVSPSTVGRFTLNMITHCGAPVIAVPHGAGARAISRILYPTDLEKVAGEVRKVVPLASAFDADIHILHVSRNNAADILTANHRLIDIRKRAGYDQITVEIVKGRNAAQHIEKYIGDHEIDMLALFSHERGFFEKFFADSVTETMCLRARIPLLIFRK